MMEQRGRQRKLWRGVIHGQTGAHVVPETGDVTQLYSWLGASYFSQIILY